jgi:dolichyl-phosphate-mannose--protein O-mannosyl transferase
MTHPLTSYWYTWFIPRRPITLRYELVDGGMVRVLTTLGNPLLWWSSTLVIFGTLGRLAWLGLRGLRAREPLPELVARLWPWLLPGAFWLAFLSPWVLTARDSYIYHYLPCYAGGLLLLAGAFARAFRRWPRASLIAFLLIAEVSVFYAPVWGQLPLSEVAYGWRLFLQSWR